MGNKHIINKLRDIKDISSIRKYVGKKIGIEIEKKGLTQESIGTKLGTSHSYINQMIKGKTGSSEKYIDLAQSIGISDDDIISYFKEAIDLENVDIFGESTKGSDNINFEDLSLDEIRMIFSKNDNITNDEAIKQVINYALEKGDKQLLEQLINRK